jgi:quercetin dioxygenase-like cupin family protein
MVRRLCLTVLMVAASAASQSIASQTKVEIENAWVRVLRVKQGPHEKSPERQHPDSVAVYLTAIHQRVNGVEVGHKSGDVAWLEAAKNTEENLSDRPLEYVLVELKPGAPKAKGWPVALDPVKLSPAHELVPFENDRVRVLRTILEPHLKGPTHDHPSYVVVYLTELHTTMTLADGKQVDNPRRPGEVAFREPYRHTTENVGDRTAVEIQIELK